MIVVFIYNKSHCFTWQPLFYVLCAMYLMDIIGMFYTRDFYSGFKRLDRGIYLVLFPVIFSMIQFPEKNVMLLLRIFVWSASAFCAYGLLSYATIVPELTWDMIFRDSKLYAPLLMMWPAHPHPSYLSTILLMAVPVALYLRFQNGKQISLIEMLLGVLLPIVYTVLSGARVGMMIAPVLLVLGYLFYCRFKPALKWGLVVVGIAAGCILLNSFPKADERFADPIRVDLRKTAISAIKEKPVFAWGTGSSLSLIQSEERAHSLGIETPYHFNQFHNQYFEDMAQFGIPGILLLLLLFGWILWVGIREKNFLLLSFLAIYMLFCWTESLLYVSKGVVPFAFWLCFLLSNRKTLHEP
jgi:O-antigen ligase